MSFRNKSVLLLEALCAFSHNGDTLPHPLPQALPPLICDHSNDTDGEAVRWRAVGVAHGQAGNDPDVAWSQQARLSRLAKQVLRLLVGTVCQQDLRVHLGRTRTRKTEIRLKLILVLALFPFKLKPI